MSISFNDICSLLQTIELSLIRQPRPSKEKEIRRIRRIITDWFTRHRESLDPRNEDAAAILSILFPQHRKDRVYGVQAKSLEKKLLALMPDISVKSGRKAILAQWRQPGKGDLGACFGRATKCWDGPKADLSTINEVNNLLVQMAARCRFSSPQIRALLDEDFDTDALFKRMLHKQESWESKWLIRLILNDYCTVQLDEHFVLTQYHFLLPDLLKFQNDFHAVAALLQGPLAAYPPKPSEDNQLFMRKEAGTDLMPIVGIKVGRPTFYKAWSFKNLIDMTSKRAWSAEIKYDGEYCEVHVDLDKGADCIQIFSKNGKDATNDREGLLGNIRRALRIGQPNCLFKRKCIVLGELVVYSDKEEKIIDFHKIRKHVSRSGLFLGVDQDSLPHEYEHLMIVFFDVLLIDDVPVMRQGLQERRGVMRKLVAFQRGRAMRSEWTLVDFKHAEGIEDLKCTFARAIAERQEGCILKPLHSPYFPLLTTQGEGQPGYYIKLKRDYLADMGGERDLGDFAVIGASYNAQSASKSDVLNLRWTHFHIGCLTNRPITCRGAQRKYKVVAVVSSEHSIPKHDLKYLNDYGQFRCQDIKDSHGIEQFEFVPYHSLGSPRMEVAFKQPFIVELLGGGFEKVQNEKFHMLRHPRIRKIHLDRTWEDAVCMDELRRMADEAWAPPDAHKLDGHARDVALRVTKLQGTLHESQQSIEAVFVDEDCTQDCTQDFTQYTSSTQRMGVIASQQLQVAQKHGKRGRQDQDDRETAPSKRMKRIPLGIVEEGLVVMRH